jgi:hypothetical protein
MILRKMLSAKAIVIGLLIELLLYAVVFIAAIAVIGITASQSPAFTTLDDRIHFGTYQVGIPAQAGNLVVVSLVLLFAGYIVGRIAKKSEIVNAGVVGGVFVIFGLWGLRQSHTWFDVVGLVATMFFHLAGGFLAQKQRLRRSAGEEQWVRAKQK